jgi:nucleoside permease NupC
LGQLFSELSEETSMLVRQEVQLAKVEIMQKVQKAGKDVALIVGGGLVAYTGVLALVAALILVLANWMAPWLAAFLVGALFVIVAAVLIVTGLNDLKEMNLTPQRTVATIKEDKEWLTRQMS